DWSSDVCSSDLNRCGRARRRDRARWATLPLILNLIPQLNFCRICLRQCARVRDTSIGNIVFLEQNPCRPVARSGEQLTARVISRNPLEMGERAVPVASRKLQLCKTQ